MVHALGQHLDPMLRIHPFAHIAHVKMRPHRLAAEGVYVIAQLDGRAEHPVPDVFDGQAHALFLGLRQNGGDTAARVVQRLQIGLPALGRAGTTSTESVPSADAARTSFLQNLRRARTLLRVVGGQLIRPERRGNHADDLDTLLRGAVGDGLQFGLVRALPQRGEILFLVEHIQLRTREARRAQRGKNRACPPEKYRC